MAKKLTREEELAKTITDAMNAFGFRKGAFCEAMAKEHRYLQAEFMVLVQEWIEYAASDRYQYDGRNEWVHEDAKKMAGHMFDPFADYRR